MRGIEEWKGTGYKGVGDRVARHCYPPLTHRESYSLRRDRSQIKRPDSRCCNNYMLSPSPAVRMGRDRALDAASRSLVNYILAPPTSEAMC